jgi:hypothetical protein
VCTVPYSETVTTSYTAPRVKSTLDILSTFVNLGTLVRHRGIGSDDLFFDFFANVHPLPECLRGLRRVDWFLFGYANSSCGMNGHSSVRLLLSVFPGLNSLYDVLEQIPQLEYLTLDGFPHTNLLPPKVLHMPRLVILRLVRVNMTLSSRIGQWSLPSLRHVIVEQLHRDERLAAIWASHPHIQTIEQGQHLNLLIRDNISFLLRSTQIKQLGYYVRFAKVPDNAPMRETLEVVHWQGASNMALESPVSHVVGHIRFLRNSELLPSLKKLVLHGGDWSTLLLNTQITSSLAILHAERPQVEIKFSNGRPVVFGTTSMV